MGYEDLPTLNASLNATSAVLLLAGFASIRARRVSLHRAFMLAAVVVSTAFLVSYLVYHFGPVPEKRFQGEGAVRLAYFAMLVSHILLAIVLVPLVAITLVHALRGRFERHRPIARITFGIWMYVSVTGILVYLSLYVW